MFHSDRWARAFLSLNDGAETRKMFLYLKAFAVPMKSLHILFYGNNDAEKMEKLIRECVESGGIEKSSEAVEYAIRFVCLLIEKRCFEYINLLLEKIEELLDERDNILNFTFETTVPVDSEAEKDFAQKLKEISGAADVKIKTELNPKLLGGCLLRTDWFYIDASLKCQLENLKTSLFTAEVGNVKL